MFSYIYLCKYVVFLFKQVNSYLTYCYITCFLHLTNILEIFIFPQICLIHFNGHKGYGCAQYIYIYIFFKYKFIYLFLAALGLCCCAQAFCTCGKRGLLFVAVRGLLIAVASLVAEHGL